MSRMDRCEPPIEMRHELRMHWLVNRGTMGTERRMLIWRPWKRSWSGRSNSPERLHAAGWRYDRPWQEGDAPEDGMARS